jgi:hypothetical protein
VARTLEQLRSSRISLDGKLKDLIAEGRD